MNGLAAGWGNCSVWIEGDWIHGAFLTEQFVGCAAKWEIEAEGDAARFHLAVGNTRLGHAFLSGSMKARISRLLLKASSSARLPGNIPAGAGCLRRRPVHHAGQISESRSIGIA